MSAGIAKGRLQEERKSWRKDHPIGFFAKPAAKGDGSTDLFHWTAGIPGKKDTDWEGGLYNVTMEFSNEYPSKPPKCEYNQCSYARDDSAVHTHRCFDNAVHQKKLTKITCSLRKTHNS